MYRHHLYGPGNVLPFGHDPHFGLAAMLIHLLFWALIVWLIVRVLSRHGQSWLHGHQLSDPLEVAKMRFAKGEITKAELNEIKHELA